MNNDTVYYPVNGIPILTDLGKDWLGAAHKYAIVKVTTDDGQGNIKTVYEADPSKCCKCGARMVGNKYICSDCVKQLYDSETWNEAIKNVIKVTSEHGKTNKEKE